MSIQSEITRLSGNVSDALNAIEAKGVTIPTGANSDDLADLIGQISGGGTGGTITQDQDGYLVLSPDGGGGGGGGGDFSTFDVEIVNNYSNDVLVQMAIAGEAEGFYFSNPFYPVPANTTVTVQGIAYKGECDAVITGVNFTVSPNTIEVSGETVFITDDCTITLTPHE